MAPAEPVGYLPIVLNCDDGGCLSAIRELTPELSSIAPWMTR